jgi:hypothetical protein
MAKKVQLSAKALRKRRRKAESDAYAKDARFWRNQKSADRLGFTHPIDRQAAKEIGLVPRKKR